MIIFIYTNKLVILPEYPRLTIGQEFIYPAPEGSELIVPAPFRDGVNRDNQFAD
jgi:hypothetical protein